MTDAELDRKLQKLEELVHSTARGIGLNFSKMRSAIENLPLIVEISLQLTREVIHRIRKLETAK